jgi:hypothetical protein
MSARKYQIPLFLQGVISQEAYSRWLARKAAAHVKRDRKRGNPEATIESYKGAIHEAVSSSGGLDDYTGERLSWELVSTYENGAAQLGRRVYKAGFATLPTVDHVVDGLGPANFKICAWRTNDAKSDLDHAAFVELCRKVISHHDASRQDLLSRSLDGPFRIE